MTSASVTFTRGAEKTDVADVFSPDALALVARLHERHAPALRELLAARPLRELPGTEGVGTKGSWRVAEPPPWFRDRRVEITGPAEPNLMVSALNSGARVFLADLEDALSPTWVNIVVGYRTLRDAAAGTLTRVRSDGEVQRPRDDAALVVVRPRGLHLPEPRLLVDGSPAMAPLVDVALVAVHTAKAWIARGTGLALYLPKLEHAEEAAWWHEVLHDVEEQVGIGRDSVPVTVLVETLPLGLQMDEVLAALQSRPAALNAGRWDYLFSLIKTIGADPAHLLPDRSAVTMRVPFMAAYAERLVAVCHARGAQAMGGMAAFIPNRRNPGVNDRAMAAVRADKEREASLGYDGTWVAHPDLVPIALEVFSAAFGDRVDQRDVTPPVPDSTAALLDTRLPGARCTAGGLAADLDAALQYLAAWLDGRGAVGVHDLMEDVATAEVSRCQVWQWLHLGVTLDDGSTVTRERVETELQAQIEQLAAAGFDRGLLEDAADVVRGAAMGEDLPPFLTLVAIDVLDRRHPPGG